MYLVQFVRCSLNNAKIDSFMTTSEFEIWHNKTNLPVQFASKPLHCPVSSQ